MTAARQTERSFQAAVIDLARHAGWTVAHFHDSRRQVRPGVLVGDRDAAGFPDLVLARGDDLVFAELKTDRGRVRPEQQAWLDALSATTAARSGCARVCVWRPADWRDIEATLRSRAGRRAA